MQLTYKKIRVYTLTHLFTQGRLASAINIFGAFYVYIFFQLSHPPFPYIFIWLATVILTSLLCIGVATTALKTPTYNTLTYYHHLYFYLILLNGISWGLCYLINATEMSVYQNLFIALTLVGATSISIIALAGSLRCYFAFLIPVMSPIIIINILSGNSDQRLFGCSMILYCIFIYIMFASNRKTLLENSQLLTRQDELIKDLNILNSKLNIASITDGLTSLANHRHFKERLAADWQRCRRAKLPLSLILIDIDFFKEYNDYYGHVSGDKCLQAIASIIKQQVQRDTDLAARPGGDEFAIILYNTDNQGANKMAHLILNTVRQQKIEHKINQGSQVSLSIGLATITPKLNEEEEDTLIKAADKSLYQAKAAGRNQII